MNFCWDELVSEFISNFDTTREKFTSMIEYVGKDTKFPPLETHVHSANESVFREHNAESQNTEQAKLLFLPWSDHQRKLHWAALAS